jgi:hypothetical protein
MGGNHLKEASGGAGGGMTAGVKTGGDVIVNVTGPLLPAGFPRELSWTATAVYSPVDNAGLASLDFQPAPVPAAVAVETSVPVAVAPS